MLLSIIAECVQSAEEIQASRWSISRRVWRPLGYFLGREGADGLFGPHTESAIRAFQQRRLLFADGVVEDNTWTELVEAGYESGERLLYLRVPYMRGDDVLYLQGRLDELGFDCGPVDGIFSPALEVAVTEFQRNAGLNVDGIVGETTLDRLRRLHKIGPDGHVSNIPDRMNGYVGQRSLPDLRVSIDPAHGGADAGESRADGFREKDLNLALGKSLAQLLESRGVLVYLVRETDVSIPLYERTESCQRVGARHPPVPASQLEPQPEGAGRGRLLLRQSYVPIAHRANVWPGT